MNETWSVATYATYLLITVPLTIWVARTLFRHGNVFLVDVFDGKPDLAAAVNHLLLVGFYLVNLGFVTLYLRLATPVNDLAGVFEALSVKVGTVMLVLGLMHFTNIWVLSRIRRRSHLDTVHHAPVQPTQYLPPTDGSQPATTW